MSQMHEMVDPGGTNHGLGKAVESPCEEEHSCQGASATFYCRDCGTYQCSKCELSLHSTRELKLHNREALVSTTRYCELWCDPKNAVALHCAQCSVYLCRECDQRMHQGRRMSHTRSEPSSRKQSPLHGGQTLVHGGRTPVHGGQTLVHGGRTPVHGGQTPVHGGQTPVHGGRTPVHGGQTPVHGGPTLEPPQQVKGSVASPFPASFLLVNDKEEITVSDQKTFIQRLGCKLEDKVKVVSIFGNTGDGKSYTLNHTFFQGQEVFRTSAHQSSCTIGIWVAYSPTHKAIFVDTEGMLGVSQNENRRTRLLLKVLAVSDIVIYRTRAERLHNDLFTFLGDASEAYWKYFSPELKATSERCKLNVPLSTMGPSVVVFHETQHTELLGEGVETPSQSKEEERAVVTAADGRELDPNGVVVQASRDLKQGGGAESFEPEATKTDQRDKEKQRTQDTFGPDSETQKPLDEVDARGTPAGQKQPEIAAAVADGTPEDWELAEEDGSSHSPLPSSTPGLTTKASTPMSAEELLRIRFAELGRIPRAFCSVEYTGTRTRQLPTDFSQLCRSVAELLRNNAVRAPRQPGVVLKALQILNEKFSGDIEDSRPSTFPDAYFTCPQMCLACGVRCDLSMNHGKGKDGLPHRISGARCKYSHQYDNKIYLCKACFNRGVETVVVPKTTSSKLSGWTGWAQYAWSGYVMECRHCGVIYRSRQHWYGNKDPEHSAIKTENKHIWSEDLPTAGQGTHNTARRILDGMGSMAGAVGSVGTRPTKLVCSWMADQIAPQYWVPNSKISTCGECKKVFTVADTKHHCRVCGGGFCDKCSSKSMPVPWRGWGNIPVRVCLSCYRKHHSKEEGGKKRETQEKDKARSSPKSAQVHHKPNENTSESNVTVRYVGEMMQSAVTGVMEYPLGAIVESARPVYWVPDSSIKRCHLCKQEFGLHDRKHHCRACGQGFCGKCSDKQRPVPSRGWDYPVRVCDSCAQRKDL